MRWFIADLLTGRDIADVQVMDTSSWARSINKPEVLTAKLDMRDPATIALKPRQTMAPGRTVLACAAGDTILAAGPIWTHGYNRDEKTLTLGALGMWSYFDHRFVLPLAAATIATDQFIVPDITAAGKTKPNPTVATYLTGLEYGTIAKRWVQQAQAWTGGNVPVLFEADRVGTRERNFEGADFKNLGTVLSQLSQVEGGPDIRFSPQFTADMLGIQWVMQTGTDASPLLASPTVFEWALDVPDSPVSAFQVDIDATHLSSTSWAAAGRSADTVLVSRATDSTLTDLGYAMFETLDSSHSSVSQQATLDGYTAEATLLGRSAADLWSFAVEANRQPFLGAYWEGDFCTLTMGDYGSAAYTPWQDPVTNWCKNPSFETDVAGWSVQNAAVATRATTQAHRGTASMQVVTPGSVVAEGVFVTPTVVPGMAVGNPWCASVQVFAPAGATMEVIANTVGTGGVSPTVSFTGTGAWQLISVPNAIAASTSPYMLIRTRSTPQAVTFYVDEALIEVGVSAPGPYFDGSGGSSGQTDLELYSWTGAPNASPSTYQIRTRQEYNAGDPYLFEGSPNQRRITAMSGDAKGLKVAVTTQAVI